MYAEPLLSIFVLKIYIFNTQSCSAVKKKKKGRKESLPRSRVILQKIPKPQKNNCLELTFNVKGYSGNAKCFFLNV